MALYILGYDPGGDNAHGVALLKANYSEIHLVKRKENQLVRLIEASIIETDTIDFVENVIAWIKNKISLDDKLIGAGLDTFTKWDTGKGGWRPADKYLKFRYNKSYDNILSPNSAQGSMSINGMVLKNTLYEINPGVIISEVHPTVLFHALWQNSFDNNQSIDKLDNESEILKDLKGCSVETKNIFRKFCLNLLKEIAEDDKNTEVDKFCNQEIASDMKINEYYKLYSKFKSNYLKSIELKKLFGKFLLSSHEQDAAISCYAVMMGMNAEWVDLHSLPELDARYVEPYGTSRYFWPPRCWTPEEYNTYLSKLKTSPESANDC